MSAERQQADILMLMCLSQMETANADDPRRETWEHVPYRSKDETADASECEKRSGFIKSAKEKENHEVKGEVRGRKVCMSMTLIKCQ